MNPDSSGVFDAGARADSLLAGHAESDFAFRNRAAGQMWDEVRALIDGWFRHLPDAARADVRGGLRSGDDRQFEGAFWELYLHESLRRAGCDITVHPEVAGSSRQPDFLASVEGATFYPEAKSISAATGAPGDTARRQRVYDEVNKLDHPDFWVAIHFRSQGQTDPRGAQIRKELREWLDGLDPDETKFGSKFDDDREALVWKCSGWEIEFRPIRVSADSRGLPNKRLIGLYDSGTPFVSDDERLGKALAAKGSAYGDLPYPLVVAVNVNAFSAGNFDIMNALYGSLQYTFDTANPDFAAVPTRAPDGYWAAGSWQHQHVAAVLVGRCITPESIARQSPTLWHHPQANPTVPCLPPWRQAVAAVDHIEFLEPAGTMAGHFGLPDPWPTTAAWEEWEAANG